MGTGPGFGDSTRAGRALPCPLAGKSVLQRHRLRPGSGPGPGPGSGLTGPQRRRPLLQGCGVRWDGGFSPLPCAAPRTGARTGCFLRSFCRAAARTPAAAPRVSVKRSKTKRGAGWDPARFPPPRVAAPGKGVLVGATPPRSPGSSEAAARRREPTPGCERDGYKAPSSQGELQRSGLANRTESPDRAAKHRECKPGCKWDRAAQHRELSRVCKGSGWQSTGSANRAANGTRLPSTWNPNRAANGTGRCSTRSPNKATNGTGLCSTESPERAAKSPAGRAAGERTGR